MNGKICMITGGSTGIGKETALGLARQGATVIIVNQNRVRGEAALTEIKALSGNGNIELMLADLSKMASVRDLAARVKAQYHRLDLLINNAGIVALERELTIDGYERTFAVNHLAPFLLTNLLLDLLKKTAGSRIINLASQVHAQTIDFDNLQAEKGFHGLAPYRLSKLANIMFTYELARRLVSSDVTVNCLHPGVIETGLLSNFNRLWAQEQGQPDPAVVKRGGLLSRVRSAIRADDSSSESVADGARQVLHLATAPELAGVSGKYWRYGQFEQSNPISYDEATAAKLWEISAELTGLSEVEPEQPDRALDNEIMNMDQHEEEWTEDEEVLAFPPPLPSSGSGLSISWNQARRPTTYHITTLSDLMVR